MRQIAATFAITLCCVLGWGADWLTDGGDVKRTGWQRDEKILTTANVKDMKLLFPADWNAFEKDRPDFAKEWDRIVGARR